MRAYYFRWQREFVAPWKPFSVEKCCNTQKESITPMRYVTSPAFSELKMLPQAVDLKYFHCVCESKNISRAAELLGISQPSLSLAIKRLEAVAGVDLFVRNKNGVDLTRAGIAFRDRSLVMLELWQSIADEVKRNSDEVAGRFSIGAHVSVSLFTLIPVVKDLMQTYQGLELISPITFLASSAKDLLRLLVATKQVEA